MSGPVVFGLVVACCAPWASLRGLAPARLLKESPLHIFVPAAVDDGIEEGRDDIMKRPISCPFWRGIFPWVQARKHDKSTEYGDDSVVGGPGGRDMESTLGEGIFKMAAKM